MQIAAKDSPIEPDVLIKLGGIEYTLCFPIQALWAFEDATGLSITEGVDPKLLSEGTRRQKIERSIALCWAGLITKHPEITRAQVGAMVFFSNLDYVDSTVIRALIATMPVKDIKEEATPAVPLEEKPLVV